MLGSIDCMHWRWKNYEIYIDGEFECSCDVGELTETLDKVEKSLKNY